MALNNELYDLAEGPRDLTRRATLLEEVLANRFPMKEEYEYSE